MSSVSSNLNGHNNKKSKIFKDKFCKEDYLEIVNEDEKIKIIFRSEESLNEKHNADIYKENVNKFNEITLIFDYGRLSLELDSEEVKNTFINIYNNIDNKNKTKLNLIIQNTYINPKNKNENFVPISDDNELFLNKLKISDELYSFTPYLNYLFPKIQINELILENLKFNSKSQLKKFCNFICSVECKKLTLDDIFIELIIKENENDEEYKDLDIYFEYYENEIILNNEHTSITSLTLRDCPLFAITGNIFNNNNLDDEDKININIDIDENSLLNPSIITKFKIFDGKYDICFDLDSFKLKLEKEDEKYKEDDDIDYFIYIFNIIISFISKEQKIKIDEDDGIGKIDRENFHKLTFKNFDITKLEYITNDDITFIDEKNWYLNDEEKKRKKKWETLENELENFEYEKLSQVKELVFDNCSNFFIKWILFFIKGKDFKKERHQHDNDFELLKIKKCAKDYIDISKILTLKLNTLILFDSPLIIKELPEKDKKNLDIIKYNLGSVENLTLKINALEPYGKEYNLNTILTYEILVELIKCPNFNKNITFEFNALSSIMTFLSYKEYLKKKSFYEDKNNNNKNNSSKDSSVTKANEIDIEDELDRIDEGKYENTIENNIKMQNNIPYQIFFKYKKFRDIIYYKALNLEDLKNSKITLKNVTIKKQTENFENFIYLLIKNKRLTAYRNLSSNNTLNKMDFGSDGFYIDRDYKYFFSQNEIKTVELKNVSFSSYKDSLLKDIEGETINNLISINNYEKKSIVYKEYETYFPNYTIDVKTLNGFLYKNYLFENVSSLYIYFFNKIEPLKPTQREENPDLIEKKELLSDYFKTFVIIFDNFKDKNLTIVINNKKELKELYCTMCILDIIKNDGNFIKEELSAPKANKYKTIKLPKKSIIEKEIGNYFLKEKNEEDKEVYTEMNYYYTSEGEINMIEEKKIKLSKTNKGKYLYEFNIEKANNYIDEI